MPDVKNVKFLGKLVLAICGIIFLAGLFSVLNVELWDRKGEW